MSFDKHLQGRNHHPNQDLEHFYFPEKSHKAFQELCKLIDLSSPHCSVQTNTCYPEMLSDLPLAQKVSES